MGLVEFDPTKYRLEYIPQRLRSLEVCIAACHSLLNGKVETTPLAINLGICELKAEDLSLFVELAIDAGLVANRTILNFLGIKLADGGLASIQDGVTISDFGLPLVSVDTAGRILLPEIPDSEMQRLWVEALRTASKSIAHFTEKGATISVARLGFACYGTAKLVRAQFYEALSMQSPKSVLPIGSEPVLGSCWDSVDPQLQIRC